MARAAEMPMRKPVKLPGPTDTTTRSMAPKPPGAWAITRSSTNITVGEDMLPQSRSTARLFLTHNYCAHPMVREARAIVAEGGIGDLRLVQADFLQGWLADDTSSKQADWRTDPAQAGAGALGDIGTHAWQLAQFVTGMTPDSLSAEESARLDRIMRDDDM